MNPADQALAARDPGLRMLAKVLDPGAVARIVGEAFPSLELRRAEAEYVRYKPATSCLVSYRFDTASGWKTGYVKTVAGDSPAKLNKMKRRGALIVGPDLAVSLLPTDATIPALTRFGGDVTGLLERLGQPLTTDAHLTPLSYKPERRYVGMVRSASRTRAVLRAYTPEGYPAARRSSKAHPRAEAVATPILLGKSDRHRALLITWLDGTPLVEKLDSGPDQLGGEVGAALKVLHESRGVAAPHIERPIAGRIVASWKAVGWLLGAADHPMDFASRLAAAVNQPQRSGPVHGDFSADQVLVGRDDGRIGVIDWDRSGLADPAWDLACFLADLETRSLAGSLPASTAANWRTSVLDGYGGCYEAGHLQRATAAALVARATEPFRHRHPDWARVTKAIVDRAQQLTAT